MKSLLKHFKAALFSVILLRPGYVLKAKCHGKLYLSSVGDERLIELQAYPKEIGCAVALKPKVGSGATNLILETSTGSIMRTVEIKEDAPPVYEIDLKMDSGVK